jgi:RES domain-containing protein
MKAVYASLSPETAAREAYQGFRAVGFVKNAIRPRVFCGASVQLQVVLDLTDRGIRRRLGFTLQELVNEDWLAIQEEGDESWTQAIGRGASVVGFEAVLAPSVRDRPAGRNLIVFPDRLRADSELEILGKSELPRHPARYVE